MVFLKYEFNNFSKYLLFISGKVVDHFRVSNKKIKSIFTHLVVIIRISNPNLRIGSPTALSLVSQVLYLIQLILKKKMPKATIYLLHFIVPSTLNLFFV